MNKAQDYDQMAESVFAPAYPLLAEQMVSRLEMKSGVCLDVGCGGGQLGYALMELIGDLRMIFADINADAVDIALDRAEQKGLGGRVKGLVCPVDRVPLTDGTADYIVSRGSLWRWKNHDNAFSELLRLLAPGGSMFIGGGFGSTEIFDQVNSRMQQIKPDWMENVKRKQNDAESLHSYAEKLETLGGETAIIDDESGRWIVCRKTG